MSTSYTFEIYMDDNPYLRFLLSP